MFQEFLLVIGRSIFQWFLNKTQTSATDYKLNTMFHRLPVIKDGNIFYFNFRLPLNILVSDLRNWELSDFAELVKPSIPIASIESLDSLASLLIFFLII